MLNFNLSIYHQANHLGDATEEDEGDEINSSGGGTLGRRRMNNGNKGLTASLTRFGKSGSRGCEQLDEVGYGKSPEWVEVGIKLKKPCIPMHINIAGMPNIFEIMIRNECTSSCQVMFYLTSFQ